MEQLLNYIDGMSSFKQGLLGSATFAVSSWLIQKLYSKIKKSGLKFFDSYSKIDVLRYVLHKNYVNSNNIHTVTYGISFVLLQSFRWALKGILIMLFFLGVNSILNAQWLFLAASWFTFNCFLEAHNWLKDSSNDKSISYIEESKRNEIIESMMPKA